MSKSPKNKSKNRMQLVFIGALVTSIVLVSSGCGGMSDLKRNRNLRNCMEFSKKRIQMIKPGEVDRCMRIRGFQDFSYNVFKERNPETVDMYLKQLRKKLD